MSEQEIPQGLVKIDAPDTLQGWKLVVDGSAEHVAFLEATAKQEAAEAEEAAKKAAKPPAKS